MSAKVIYVGGVPATGKSTLFRELRKELLPEATEFRVGKVRGVEQGNVKMLGVFDGSTFEGTDRLSMTVIDDAIKYIEDLSKLRENCVILVEGDRLFNYRFLSAVKASLIVLTADDDVLAQRHIERGDTQTDTFLRSRKTKVDNLCAKCKVMPIPNNTPADAERIKHAIVRLVNTWSHHTMRR